MKNTFKTLIFSLIVGLAPQLGFCQINYNLSAELGQNFAGIENKTTTAESFFLAEGDFNAVSQLSPIVGLAHDFSFGENAKFGLSLRTQFAQINFTRSVLKTYQDPDYQITSKNTYQTNQLQIPVEVFWKIGKFRISTGIVNNWDLKGKVSISEGNEGQSYYTSFFETNKVLGGSYYGLAGWSSDTNFEKKYSIQYTAGLDLQLSKRWQMGADFRTFLTKNSIKADVFDYDVFYDIQFQHQTNSIVVLLSYLLLDK